MRYVIVLALSPLLPGHALTELLFSEHIEDSGNNTVFYMAVRYEGNDGNTPDLDLVDVDTDEGEPRLGHLCSLLAWHQADPVSDAERQRNDVIQR